MAKSKVKDGISITKNNVPPRLLQLEANVKTAMANGVTTSVSASTVAMMNRVIGAATYTGGLRAAGVQPPWTVRAAWWKGHGPGRVESGRMLGSIKWQLKGAGTSRIDAIAGFIDPPSYLKKQEEGVGGTGWGHIPKMGAYALGHTTMTAMYPLYMRREIRKALTAARNGKGLKAVA